MSYKFYLGPSGAGKTYQLNTDIIDISMKYPEKQIIVITPDQYTMQTQRDIVLSHPNKAMMNIEIMSFNRLAGYIFEEVGMKKRLVLDDTGKNLILRKISLEMRDELTNLGSNVDKQGYIHEIKSVISEFMQYGISVKNVDDLIKLSADKPSLNGRLMDLQKLYAGFMDAISEKYLTIEERLSILSGVIDKSEVLSGSLVVFDGFTGFTPVQGQVISSILSHASEVWFAVTIDADILHDNKVNPGASLFSLSIKTVRYIEKLAKECNCYRDRDVVLKQNLRLENNEELAFLEKNIFRNYGSDNKYDKDIENICITVCDNPRQELENVAASINAFVRQGNKYKDIAVVTGDLERYAPYVHDVFGAAGIPYFLDSTKKLVLNPFTEYILCGLDILLSDFAYDSIIHFLRTGLTGIKRNRIDILDNYLLARGIKGLSRWKKKFIAPATYMKEQVGKKRVKTEKTEAAMKEINEIREEIMSILSPIVDMKSGKKYKAIDICEKVYTYIVENNIAEKLDYYADKFEEEGNYVREKEYSQVYEKVLEVFDQIAGLVNEDEITIDEFVKLLQAGIGEIKIGVLPPGMDYVPIGDIERARLSDIKNLYFIGVNDGVIPKSGTTGGLISDLDRNFFEDKGVELSPSPRQKMSWQKLYLYANMTKPTKKLYISFSKRDAGGKTIRPSYLVQEILDLYPRLTKKYLADKEIFNNIFTLSNCSTAVSESLREFASGTIIERERLARIVSLYNVFRDIYRDKADMLLDEAYNHKKDIDSIGRELVKALYGEIITSSISRLEEYANCAYKHYLDYGLGLKEREEASFDNLDIGNVIHEALKKFYLLLEANGDNWKTISKEKMAKYVHDILTEEISGYNENIAVESARTTYQIKRLERILLRATTNMAYHLNKGLFYPKAVEIEFEDELTGDLSMTSDISKDVADNSELDKVYIQGKIDRIDTYDNASDRIYVKVVDYKSGNKDVDLIKVYQGKQLQLLVYLDQAIKLVSKGKSEEQKNAEVLPAGVFYYHVFDPIISTDSEVSDNELQGQINKELRSKGLFINNPENNAEIVKMLDSKLCDDILAATSSDVVNATIKTKDDEVTITGDAISGTDMKTLVDYAKYKVVNLSKEIKSGNISHNCISEDTCKYCVYKDICNKDSANLADKDEKLDDAEVLNKMHQELDGTNNITDNPDNNSDN